MTPGSWISESELGDRSGLEMETWEALVCNESVGVGGQPRERGELPRIEP